MPHHETESQRSVSNVSSCILGNQGCVLISELITELLTAFIANNTTYKRKNRYSKIINVADYKTCKKRLLAVEYLILIIYNYSTAKTRTLYKSTDGLAGRPSDNPSNSDGLGDFHWMVPELTIWVYWQPGPPICQRFSCDPDQDPKQRSRTVANSNVICYFSHHIRAYEGRKTQFINATIKLETLPPFGQYSFLAKEWNPISVSFGSICDI